LRVVKWRVCAGLYLNDDHADQGYSFGAVNRINNWNQIFFFPHSNGKWNVNIESDNVWNMHFVLELHNSICILRNVETSIFWDWKVFFLNDFLQMRRFRQTSVTWSSCKVHSTGRNISQFVGDYEAVSLRFYGEFDTFYVKLIDCKYVRILYTF
jgi:hypothetical protein